MATTERPIRNNLDGEVSLELAVSRWARLVRLGTLASRERALSLIGCSRCLRVLRDQEWVHAKTVIRELRSFEYEAAPHFESVLCPICTVSIQLRRVQARARLGRTNRTRARGRH